MASAKRWSYQAGEHGRNRVTAYERSSGIIYLKFYPRDQETGERHRKRISLEHRDRNKGKRQADELAARLARGQPEQDSRTTLRELFDNWLREQTPQVSKRQQKHHHRMAELFCRYYGPEREAEDLNRRDWDRFVQDRSSGAIDARGREVSKGERKPRAPNTVKKNLKTLRAALNWGVEADLLDHNPTNGYPMPSEDDPHRPRVSQDRYEAMLEVAGEVDWRLKLALVLAHETGHRIGAIRRLRWADVDLDEGHVWWRSESDKTGNGHKTPVTEVAVEALREARRERPGVGEAWVFPSPEEASQPCSRHLMRDWWLRAEDEADLEHVNGLGWHGLRRKFADEHRDVPLKDLADLGGWKTPRTVSEVYQGSDVDAMRRALRQRRVLGGNSDSG